MEVEARVDVTDQSDVPAGPEPTTEQVADAGVAEDAATEAASDGQASPAEAPQVNWDSDDNPHYKEAQRLKDTLAGTQGSHKQLQAELQNLRTQLQQIERDRESERQRQLSEQKRAEILREIEEDGGPLAQKLKTQLDLQVAQERWQAEHTPRIAGQVRQEAEAFYRSQYYNGLTQAGEALGLTQAELQQLAQERPAFNEFIAGFIERGVSKRMGDIDKLVEKTVETKLKTLDTDRAATSRASQSSPNTATGKPAAANDDEALIAHYASNGNVSKDQLRRVHELLGV